jgi:hypothetical protein
LDNWRQAVEAELGEPVADGIWAELDERGDIEDLDLGLATPDQVATRIKNVTTGLSAPLPGQAVRTGRADLAVSGLPEASEAARARIDALSAIYAAWAESSWEVRRFRETVLARTRAGMAAQTGAPAPANGAGFLLSDADVPAWIRWRFAADSPDGDGDPNVRALISSTPPGSPRRVADLWYFDNRQERALTVDARGELAQLAKLAQDLADRYRWRPCGATMLVLAGQRPEVFVYLGSAEIRYGEANATTRVTMTVDPALTEEEVAEIYGRLRQRFHPARPPRYQSTRRYHLAGHVGPHVRIRLGEPGSRHWPGRPPAPGRRPSSTWPTDTPGRTCATSGTPATETAPTRPPDAAGSMIRQATSPATPGRPSSGSCTPAGSTVSNRQACRLRRRAGL